MHQLPRNVYIISLVIALSFSSTSMLVLIGGLVGQKIAPSAALATLPITMQILGCMVASIPAAFLMKKIGRKKGVALAIVIAIIGCYIAYQALLSASFFWFCVGAFIIGINTAFAQQGRFIILDNTTGKKQQAKGLTLGLMAILLAAFIGPNLGLYGHTLLAVEYSGAFILLITILILALFILFFYQEKAPAAHVEKTHARKLSVIARQPLFILSAGSAAIGYAIMSFVMTATPINMHHVNGHSLANTSFVIQTHVIAMYLPSLLSGYLLQRCCPVFLLKIGLLLYITLSFIAFNGVDVLHYWWALLLLGLGWNMLFMTATSLLPTLYKNDTEKFKTQACNDFIVFFCQGIASLSAGWALSALHWHGIITIALSVSIIWLGMIFYMQRSTKEAH